MRTVLCWSVLNEPFQHFELSSFSVQRLVDFVLLPTISQHRLLRSSCLFYRSRITMSNCFYTSACAFLKMFGRRLDSRLPLVRKSNVLCIYRYLLDHTIVVGNLLLAGRTIMSMRPDDICFH